MALPLYAMDMQRERERERERGRERESLLKMEDLILGMQDLA